MKGSYTSQERDHLDHLSVERRFYERRYFMAKHVYTSFNRSLLGLRASEDFVYLINRYKALYLHYLQSLREARAIYRHHAKERLLAKEGVNHG